jgi:hypothetical protein
LAFVRANSSRHFVVWSTFVIGMVRFCGLRFFARDPLMIKIVKYIAVAGLIASAPATAAADDLTARIGDEVMNACRPDYQRVCAYVAAGNRRAGRCLLEHERELSPPCLKAVKLAYAIEACLPDYRRLCAGAPLGAKSVECLAARTDSLDPECRRVVEASAAYMGPEDNRYGYNRGPGPQADRFGYGAGPGPQGDRSGYGAGPRPQGDRFGYGSGPGLQGDRFGYGPGPGPQGDRFGYGPGPGPQGDRFGYGPGPGSQGDRFGYGPGPGPGPQGDRFGYGPGPAPQGPGPGPQGDRFGYNRGPAPYGAPYPGGYTFRQAPRDDGGYTEEGDRGDGGYDRRYAEGGSDRPREQPYGDAPDPERGYDNGGREPYAPEGNREPIK